MALGRAIEKQQAEIARMEAFVERFRYKATKARQAQSRLKRLDKIERIERDPRDTRELGFRFGAVERSGRVVFEMTGGRLEVGEGHVLLDDAEIWLERGEHVSLVGANGTGKTTLIEALAGRTPLAAGKISRGHNVKLGYLSQHAEELTAGGARTVLEACQKLTGLTPGKARALLGTFLFSGEEVEKPLDGISGGERQRLTLAVLVSSGANVLILDEPTNHLDLDAREALEDALSAYEGALLLVSHDRALLDAVGSRTVAVEDGTLRSYVGGWPEYVRVREERKAKPKAAAKSAPARKAAAPQPKPAKTKTKAKAAKAGPGGNGNGPSKNARRRLRELEREVEQAETVLKQLEDELAAPDAWATPEASAAASERHRDAKRAVEEAYARWEAAGT
jgi:ATP-binding cassette subfamily F protein 3